MEQSYWLGRKRDAAANARRTGSSRARLVHLDLAGRYSVLAARAAEARPHPLQAREAIELSVAASEFPDAAYYERLETGARWLASQAGSEAERHEYLGIANLHARRRTEAATDRRSRNG